MKSKASLICVILLAAIVLTVVMSFHIRDAFKLDSVGKYQIVTNTRFMTIQNDKSTYTNIYYLVDLNKGVVSKNAEGFRVNSNGDPAVFREIVFKKKVDKELREKIKSSLDDILGKEDVNDTNRYDFYTISTWEETRYIYNKKSTEGLANILKSIDDYER